MALWQVYTAHIESMEVKHIIEIIDFTLMSY